MNDTSAGGYNDFKDDTMHLLTLNSSSIKQYHTGGATSTFWVGQTAAKRILYQLNEAINIEIIKVT